MRQKYAHLAPPDYEEKRKRWFPRDSSSSDSDEDDNSVAPYTQDEDSLTNSEATRSLGQNSSGRCNTFNSDELPTAEFFFATFESDDDEGLEPPEPSKPRESIPLEKRQIGRASCRERVF